VAASIDWQDRPVLHVTRIVLHKTITEVADPAGLFAAILSIGPWGYTEEPFEHPCQVLLVGEPAVERDLCNTRVGCLQAALCELHPALH